MKRTLQLVSFSWACQICIFRYCLKNAMAPVLSQSFPLTMIILCHSYTMVHLQYKKSYHSREENLTLGIYFDINPEKTNPCSLFSGVGLQLLSIRWAEKKIHECKHIKLISHWEIFKWNKLSDKFSNHNLTHEKKRFQIMKLNISLKDYEIDFKFRIIFLFIPRIYITLHLNIF